MNTILNKISLLLILTIMLIGCTEQENETFKHLSIQNTEMEISGDGGVFSIDYSIKNPIPNSIIDIKADKEWINNEFDLNETGKIRFIAESNYTTETRTATISITYTGSEETIDVIITQNSGMFGITVNSISETGANVEVIPHDKEMTYTLMSVSKKYYDELGTDEKLFEMMMDKYRQYAEMYKMDLSDFLEQAALFHGDYTGTLSNLNVNTEYYFFAVGLNKDGTQTSPIVKHAFKTKDIEKIDIKFDIRYEINGPDVTISVSPSDKEQLYFFNAIEKKELEESGKNIEEYANDYIAGQIVLGEFFGQSAEDVISSLSSKGDDSYSKCFKPETDYITFAFALTNTGIIISNVTTDDFRTESVQPSQNEITITPISTGVDTVQYSVKTTNNDPYVCIVRMAEEFDGMTESDIIEKISYEYELEELVKNGTQTITINRLRPDTEYMIFAFGYYAGGVTTRLFKTGFRTAASDNPELLSFSFSIKEIRDKTATIEIDAKPETALYLWSICPSGTDKNALIKELEGDIKYMIDMGHFDDRTEYMRAYGERGNSSSTFPELTPDTEYQVYAVGIYDANGEFATDFQFSETFRTKESVTSDTRINVNLKAYYDGTEAAEKYPEDFGDAAGFAIALIEADIEGEYSDYYYHIFNNDLTDTIKYSNDLIIDNLVKSGIHNKPKAAIYCTFNEVLTILGVSKDLDGNYSDVFRKTVKFTQSGVSPIEEFNTSSTYRRSLQIKDEDSHKKAFFSCNQTKHTKVKKQVIVNESYSITDRVFHPVIKKQFLKHKN